jgi:hypothetical protein
MFVDSLKVLLRPASMENRQICLQEIILPVDPLTKIVHQWTKKQTLFVFFVFK